MEEREKLRKTLEEASAKVTIAEARTTELQSEVDRLKGTVEAIEKAKIAGGDVDIKKLVAEITDSVKREFNTASDKNRVAQEAEFKALQSRVTAFELKELEAQLVAEVGGYEKVVRAVIRGSTADEIRASVKLAHEAYLEIAGRIAPAAPIVSAATAQPVTVTNGQGNRPSLTAPPVVVPAGQGGAGGAVDSSVLAGVKTLSKSEYKNNRERIQADMQRRYPAARR